MLYVVLRIRSHRCPNCQAPIRISKDEDETICRYCGSHVVQAKKSVAPPPPRVEPGPKPRPVKAAKGSATLIASLMFLGIALLGFGAFAIHGVVEDAILSTTLAAEAAKAVAESDSTSGSEIENKRDSMTTLPAKTATKEKSKKRARREKARAKARARAGDLRPLGKSTAKRVLRRVHMLHCSESGRAKVSVEIAPDGKVSKAQARGNSPAEVLDCVTETVEALRFPRSPEGLTTTHSYKW